MNKFALKAAVVMFAATSFLSATKIPAVAAGWMDVIKFLGPRTFILQEWSAFFGLKLAEMELSSARLVPAWPNMTSTFKDATVIFNKEAVAAKNSWGTFEIGTGKLSVDYSRTVRGLKLKVGDINLYKLSLWGTAGIDAVCDSVNPLKYKKCIEAIAKGSGVMQPVPGGSNKGDWMESAGQPTNPNSDLGPAKNALSVSLSIG